MLEADWYEEVEGRLSRVSRSRSVAEWVKLAEEHLLTPGGYMVHAADAWWHAEQFELSKEGLLPGVLMLALDFAENHPIRFNHEFRSTYVSRASASLLVLVAYWRDIAGGELC